MANVPVISLRPGRDAHLKNRHHAIFATSVTEKPACTDGSIVEVRSSAGEFLCYATWNSRAYIAGRAFAFEQGDPLAVLRRTIACAIALRQHLFHGEETTACRLVNAEGDALPGIIVDRYDRILVLQCTTLGMDVLREWIVSVLRELVPGITGIFEKSAGPARKKEGLEPREGWLWGSGDDSVTVLERGMQFLIHLRGSQKTGLFLDQREMRALVRTLARGRTVLDCCSYVGGFSLAALLGGALRADAVDYDADALRAAEIHMAMNGVEMHRFAAHKEDVFNFLRRRPYPAAYDFVILDPPAFAKRSTDLDPARRAYTDLNRLGMQALPPSGGLLLTCSCSYQMDAATFQTVVFTAARQAGRSVRILHRHRQALDHPVNLFHPESEYLKSILAWIE